MSKKKVLFITPSLCQGGIEHSLITALKLLDKTKYDITLFTYLEDLTLLPLVPREVRIVSDTEKPHYFRKPRALLYNGLKLISQIIKAKKFNERISEKFKNYIHLQKVKHPSKDIFKNEKYDIVISYAIGICTEMALCFDATRYYTFFHSSHDLHHEMLEKIFPEFSGIVAVNDSVKQMLVKNYPYINDKIIVLKNYVNSKQIIDKSKEKVNINKNKLMLCTCGRLSKEKGFDLAVESANILKNKGFDFIWYFVGDGDERKKVESLINNYGLKDNIKITGYTKNPFPYYKACDIYIQPSYEEAQPLAILEAMILGKATVSTKTIGGTYILENGKKGILTEMDGGSLAKGIVSLVKNPYLKKSFENLYTIEENEKEKQIYIEKWNDLLCN